MQQSSIDWGRWNKLASVKKADKAAALLESANTWRFHSG